MVPDGKRNVMAFNNRGFVSLLLGAVAECQACERGIMHLIPLGGRREFSSFLSIYPLSTFPWIRVSFVLQNRIFLEEGE